MVVSRGSGKRAGDNDDDVTVRGSFTVHTLIHLILHNSDCRNGDDDTRASPIVRLVSSPPGQLLHSSSVFSQKGKGVYTRVRSGGGKEVSGRRWVNHTLLLPISTFPPQLQTMVRTPTRKSRQPTPLELKYQSYVHRFSQHIHSTPSHIASSRTRLA